MHRSFTEPFCWSVVSPEPGWAGRWLTAWAKFLATVPFYLIGVLSPTLTISVLVLIVPTALGLAWLGPVISAVQHLVPPNMRATASAIFLFVNNLIGIGIGTFAIGAISDGLQARFGEESLRYAILTGTTFYLMAAIIFLLTARRLEQDWEG